MERVTFQRDLIKTILAEHKQFEQDDLSETVITHFVLDDTNDEYLMIHTGWDPQSKKRIYGVVFHAWLKDGKIWIERDNVLPSVANELIERGIPQEEISFTPYQSSSELEPVPSHL